MAETQSEDEKPGVRALNERLGITSRDSLFDSRELKSVQEMLESSRREFEEFSKSIAPKKESVGIAEDAATKAVAAIERMKESGIEPDASSLKAAEYSVMSFKDAVDSMNSLIATGQCIISKLYDAISSTDLVDPDIIESTAKIIESVHVNLTDIMTFSQQKMTLEFDYRRGIEMEDIKHRHALEKEYFKHKLKMIEKDEDARRKMELAKAAAIDVPAADSTPGFEWSQLKAMEMVRASDKEDAVDAEILNSKT